jgi:DNA-binding transcriptional ArsR family regulator
MKQGAAMQAIAEGTMGTTLASRTTKAATVPRPAEAGAGDLMDQAQHASDFLKALSHPARLVILCLLVEGEKSVSELEQILKLRQPAVSQQLARLRADDLVEVRRDGKNMYYALARAEVREVITVLHRLFCENRRD